jgi:hypothetical protein
MKPASALLGKLPFPADSVTVEEVVRAAWKTAVGKRIAVHSRAVKLVRSHLIVEVDDEGWRSSLFSLSKMIVQRLETRLGAGVVADIEFRIAARRRDPQRAVAAEPGDSAPPLLADDANGIEDPVLRRIYKVARRRETA